jgi:hypothetical protein
LFGLLLLSGKAANCRWENSDSLGVRILLVMWVSLLGDLLTHRQMVEMAK